MDYLSQQIKFLCPICAKVLAEFYSVSSVWAVLKNPYRCCGLETTHFDTGGVAWSILHEPQLGLALFSPEGKFLAVMHMDKESGWLGWLQGVKEECL